MKAKFDLQKPQFSSDESDDDIKMPYDDLIRMYNREYGIMFTQAKTFYSECKNAIAKTLSLNQLGMGFNVPLILNKFFVMENSLTEPHKSIQLQKQWGVLREKYEQDFHEILSRMRKVIQDLLQFEVDIKLAYLGRENKNPVKPIKLLKKLSEPYSAGKTGRISENTSSVSIQKSQKHDQHCEESILRGILHKNMTPHRDGKEKVCKINKKPIKNLEQLLQKTGELCEKIKSSKQKEEKIWTIFNNKRPSRLASEVELQILDFPYLEQKDADRDKNGQFSKSVETSLN